MVRNPAANDPALCNGHTASPACAGQSHEQRLFYDQVGNRIRLEDPDGGISAWAYDGAGLVAQQWRGNGQSHTFTYDAFGRMQRIHPVNPPTAESDIVFTYGAATAPNPTARGRLIRVDDDEGSPFWPAERRSSVGWTSSSSNRRTRSSPVESSCPTIPRAPGSDDAIS